jgi:hypothetical protein
LDHRPDAATGLRPLGDVADLPWETAVIQRRTFLAGVFSAFAAPAIVRAASIMPVKVMPDLSRIDDLYDVQRIKTVLLRQTLDNLYLTNNPRQGANEASIFRMP